jgi:hypothetical protein
MRVAVMMRTPSINGEYLWMMMMPLYNCPPFAGVNADAMVILQLLKWPHVVGLMREQLRVSWYD